MMMNNKAQCNKCRYMKKYDYGRKIYYCNHADRIDDMGKLSVDNLPEAIPKWCPLKMNGSSN